MTEYVIFTIAVVYQITQIISESTIFKPLRNIPFIGSFLSCFLCTSVWIGFLVSKFVFDYANYLGLDCTVFLSGLFYSCVVWFIHVIEHKLLK